jgi:hypothetical protein
VPDDEAAVAVDAEIEHSRQEGRLGQVHREPGQRQGEGHDSADEQQRAAPAAAGRRRPGAGGH